MLSFLIIGTILRLSAGFAPGPLLALVISETLQHGKKAGVKVALAPVLTDLPIIAITLLILAKLSEFSLILGLISLTGACFILYLGIMDAAGLADVITDALQAQRQWSAGHTLRKYERRRKGDNRVMEATMTGFKHLFGNDNPLLTEIRNIGLNVADHAGPIKRMLINQALGEH